MDEMAEKLNCVMSKHFWMWQWELIDDKDKEKYKKAAAELFEFFKYKEGTK